MRERIAAFWKGPVVDRVLAACGVLGLGGLMALFGQIVEMALDYPWPLAFVSGASFFIGVLFAYLFGLRDARVRRYEDEKKKLEEREIAERRKAEKLEKLELDISNDFKHADFDVKLVIFEMYKSGKSLFLEEPDDCCGLYWELQESKFVSYEEGPDGCLFDLRQETKKFFDDHPELLAYTSKEWEKLRSSE